MDDIAIRVEHLSKQYRLGMQQAAYTTFRESLVSSANAPLRWIKGERRKDPNLFWALDDVSFEVKHGEAIGIIGRNGAGKSTLLKILSHITSPTRGRVEIFGRVGSLLEVGTGFHPELSGRENIFLNGAILGMSGAEITRKFDEIVDFSGVEKFLDTPVKFYSSGMYVRLAFAVAAHLEPEILVVDEVLAVGDAEFQKKCLGKMGDVAYEGRTVLFVSHNMAAVIRLCKKTIWIERGIIKEIGESKEITNHYLSEVNNNSITSISFPANNNQRASFLSATLVKEHEGKKTFFSCQFSYIIIRETLGAVVALRIESEYGNPVITTTDCDLDPKEFSKNKGKYQSSVRIPSEILAPGNYRITFSLSDMLGTRFDFKESVLSFSISQNPEIKTTFTREGFLLIPIYWNTRKIK